MQGMIKIQQSHQPVHVVKTKGLHRTIGILGLVVGALLAMTVLVVGSAMTDMVIIGILLMQAIWNIAVSALLHMGKQDNRAGTSPT